MKQKNFKSILALIVLMVFANINLAMGQNMNRWVELTLTQGDSILFDIQTAEQTTVKIVSGSYSETFTNVGGSGGWSGWTGFKARTSTITIYGDLTGLDLYHSYNGSKITIVDASNHGMLTWLRCKDNTGITSLRCANNAISNLNFTGCSSLEYLSCYNNQLISLDFMGCPAIKTVYCHGNNFTTQQLDDIYCSLPQRAASDNAGVGPIYNSSSSNYATVMASNKQNAINKGWRVRYFENSADIPATSGSYACTTTYYRMEIAGTRVTSDNWSNITGPGISGSVTYDHSTKTLTLNNATINRSSYQAIESERTDQLTIKLIGTNNLTSTTTKCISTKCNTEIKGSGSLYVKTGQLSAIGLAQDNNLTISGGCFVQAEGGYAINAPISGTTAGTLTVNNSTLKAKGTWGSITGIQGLTLIDAVIAAPSGAYFSPSLGGVALSGSLVQNDWVEIKPLTVNMDRWVEIEFPGAVDVQLDLAADAANTKVKIVSGTIEEHLTVGTSWTGWHYFSAGASTMRIYGDITHFDCSGNGNNIIKIDASNHGKLKQLRSSNNTSVTNINCRDNELTLLYVAGCTDLKTLSASNNRLTSLGVSGLTSLESLSCRDNKLTSLNISGCTALNTIYCHGNNFTTQALDDIFCSLPSRLTYSTYGIIEPIYNSSSSNYSTVMATNKQNAISKDWKVQYFASSSDIPATTGSYTCPGSTAIDLAESAFSIYPNPAQDEVTISIDDLTSDAKATILDMQGRVLGEYTLSATTGKATVDVSTLVDGVYMVRIVSKDINRVERLIIKR